MEFCNAVEMCHELASLKTTLKRPSLGNTEALQEIALEKLKYSNLALTSRANWAPEALKEIAVKKDHDRWALDGLDPYFLSYVSLGSLNFCLLPEDQNPSNSQSDSCRKRAAFQNLEERPNRCRIVEHTQSTFLDPLANAQPTRAHQHNTPTLPIFPMNQTHLISPLSAPLAEDQTLSLTYVVPTVDYQTNSPTQTQDPIPEVSTLEYSTTASHNSSLESQLEILSLGTPLTDGDQDHGENHISQRKCRPWKKEARITSQRRNPIRSLEAGESSWGTTTRRLDFQ